MTATKGNRFELSCGGISYPLFNVTWFKNNKELTSISNIYTDTSRNNRTAALVFTSANLTDEGFYHCVLTNSLGSATSRTIWVEILCKCCSLHTNITLTIYIHKLTA